MKEEFKQEQQQNKEADLSELVNRNHNSFKRVVINFFSKDAGKKEKGSCQKACQKDESVRWLRQIRHQVLLLRH